MEQWYMTKTQIVKRRQRLKRVISDRKRTGKSKEYITRLKMDGASGMRKSGPNKKRYTCNTRYSWKTQWRSKNQQKFISQ
jgi:hypothetical protein